MQLDVLHYSPIFFDLMNVKNQTRADRFSDASFSATLEQVLTKGSLPREDVIVSDRKKLCDCTDEEELDRLLDQEEGGIAACMDCACRERGQCALWNYEEGKDAFQGMLQSAPARSLPRISSADRSKIREGFAAMRQREWLDYSNAYASVKKKIKYVNLF